MPSLTLSPFFSNEMSEKRVAKELAAMYEGHYIFSKGRWLSRSHMHGVKWVEDAAAEQKILIALRHHLLQEAEDALQTYLKSSYENSRLVEKYTRAFTLFNKLTDSRFVGRIIASYKSITSQ